MLFTFLNVLFLYTQQRYDKERFRKLLKRSLRTEVATPTFQNIDKLR